MATLFDFIQGSARAPAAQEYVSPVEQSYGFSDETPLQALGQGVRMGVDQTQALGYGLASMTFKSLGLGKLDQAAWEGYQRNMQEASQEAPLVSSVRDIGSLDDGIDWAFGALGQALPSLVGSVASGGVGVLAAKSLAKGTLAREFAKRQMEKDLGEQAARELITRGVPRATAKEYVGKVMADPVQRAQIGKLTSQWMRDNGLKAGMAGAYAFSGPMGVSEVYTELRENGIEAPGTALGIGAISGALDIIPEAVLASGLVKKALGQELKKTAGEEGGDSLLKTLGINIAKQAPLEGVTEGSQEYLQLVARAIEDPAFKINERQNWMRVMDAAAAGAVVGVFTGGGGGVIDWALDKGRTSQDDKPKAVPRRRTPPPAGGVPDTPTAEPLLALRAQVAAVRDPKDPKQAVLFPVDNEAAIPELTQGRGSAIGIEGTGTLWFANTAQSRRAAEELAAGADPQLVIGKYTGSSEPNAEVKQEGATVVVNRIDPQGNTIETTATTPDNVATVAASKEGKLQPGQTVQVTTPEDELAKRREGIAAEQSQFGAAIPQTKTLGYEEETTGSEEPAKTAGSFGFLEGAEVEDESSEVSAPEVNPLDDGINQKLLALKTQKGTPAAQSAWEEYARMQLSPQEQQRLMERYSVKNPTIAAEMARRDLLGQTVRELDVRQASNRLKDNPNTDNLELYLSLLNKSGKKAESARLSDLDSLFDSDPVEVKQKTYSVEDGGFTPMATMFDGLVDPDIQDQLDANADEEIADRDPSEIEVDRSTEGFAPTRYQPQLIGKGASPVTGSPIPFRNRRAAELYASKLSNDDVGNQYSVEPAQDIDGFLVLKDENPEGARAIDTRSMTSVNALEQAEKDLLNSRSSLNKVNEKQNPGLRKRLAFDLIRANKVVEAASLEEAKAAAGGEKVLELGNNRYAIGYTTQRVKAMDIAKIGRRRGNYGVYADPRASGAGELIRKAGRDSEINRKGQVADEFLAGLSFLATSLNAFPNPKYYVTLPNGKRELILDRDSILNESKSGGVTSALTFDQVFDPFFDQIQRETKQMAKTYRGKNPGITKSELRRKQEEFADNRRAALWSETPKEKIAGLLSFSRGADRDERFEGKPGSEYPLIRVDRLKFKDLKDANSYAAHALNQKVKRDNYYAPENAVVKRLDDGSYEVVVTYHARTPRFNPVITLDTLIEDGKAPVLRSRYTLSNDGVTDDDVLLDEEGNPRINQPLSEVEIADTGIIPPTDADIESENREFQTDQEVDKELGYNKNAKPVDTTPRQIVTRGFGARSRAVIGDVAAGLLRITGIKSPVRIADSVSGLKDEVSKLLGLQAADLFARETQELIDQKRPGFVWMAGNQAFIYVDPKLPIAEQIKVLAHELGHVVTEHWFAQLSESKQQLLIEAHAKDNQDLSFEEWLANQFVKWAKEQGAKTRGDQPVATYHKLIAQGARLFQRMWNYVRNISLQKGYRLNETFEQFINAVMELNRTLDRPNTSGAIALDPFSVYFRGIGNVSASRWTGLPPGRTEYEGKSTKSGGPKERKSAPVGVFADSDFSLNTLDGTLNEKAREEARAYAALLREQSKTGNKFEVHRTPDDTGWAVYDMGAPGPKVMEGYKDVAEALPRMKELRKETGAIVHFDKKAGGLIRVIRPIKPIETKTLAYNTPQDNGGSAVIDKVKEWGSKVDAALRSNPKTGAVYDNGTSWLGSMGRSLIVPIHGRLKKYNIPALETLRKVFSLDPSETSSVWKWDNESGKDVNSLIGATYYMQRDADMQRLGTEAADIAAALYEIPSLTRDLDLAATDPAAFAQTPTGQRVQPFMDKLLAYMRQNGLNVNRVNGYWPIKYNLEEISNNREAIAEQLLRVMETDPEATALGPQEREDRVRRILNSLTRWGDQLPLDEAGFNLDNAKILTKGFNSIVLNRQLTRAERAVFAENNLILNDPMNALTGYVRSAVNTALFNKYLGDTTWEERGADKPEYARRLKMLLQEVKRAPGLKPSDMEFILDSVDAMLGRYKFIDDPKVRAANDSMALYQSTRTLMFTTLASLPDLSLQMMRAGDAGMAFRVLRDNLGQALSGKGELWEATRALGLIHETMQAHMSHDMEHYSQPGTLQKLNSWFWKYTGIERWSNAMRATAVALGQEYITKHAALMDSDRMSKLYMEELNLTREDVETWERAGRPIYGRDGYALEEIRAGLSNRDEATTQAVEKVSAALMRFANEATINANPAEKTLWGNSPAFKLLWMLKSYMYGYWQRVIKRAAFELKNRGLMGISPIYLPAIGVGMVLAAVGMELRDLLQYRLWGKESWTDKLTGMEYLESAFVRGGFLGPAQLVVDIRDASERGRAPVLAVAGPTLTQFNDLFQYPAYKNLPAGTPLLAQLPFIRDPIREEIKELFR